MNSSPESLPNQARTFLGVNFAACRVYGRLYKNREGTAYVGQCPRCGKFVQVPIGAHGTSQRFFIVDCGP
jgi:hypothetical protein